MKTDTVFVILKGIGLIGGALVSAFVGGISQWANDGRWPDPLNWMLIGATTLGAGFAGLVAFCSGSVENWRQARTNGNAPPAVKP